MVFISFVSTIREVVLVPNRHWGGEGLLGCVFGCVFRSSIRTHHSCVIRCRFGLLHRIPPLPADREPGAIPAELMFEAEEYEEQQLFVPADLDSESETPEQMAQRLQWEHEQWAREEYARNFTGDASYEESGNQHDTHAHGLSAQEIADAEEFDVHDQEYEHIDHHEEHHDHGHTHNHDHIHSQPPTTVPATPFRSTSFGAARSSTPTPTRPSPLGTYTMNGDSSSSKRA